MAADVAEGGVAHQFGELGVHRVDGGEDGCRGGRVGHGRLDVEPVQGVAVAVAVDVGLGRGRGGDGGGGDGRRRRGWRRVGGDGGRVGGGCGGGVRRIPVAEVDGGVAGAVGVIVFQFGRLDLGEVGAAQVFETDDAEDVVDDRWWPS